MLDDKSCDQVVALLEAAPEPTPALRELMRGKNPEMRLGCVGAVTDAKPSAVGSYETLGFLAPEGVREGLLVSEPLPMFLGIKTIATSLAQ